MILHAKGTHYAVAQSAESYQGTTSGTVCFMLVCFKHHRLRPILSLIKYAARTLLRVSDFTTPSYTKSVSSAVISQALMAQVPLAGLCIEVSMPESDCLLACQLSIDTLCLLAP